MAEGDRREALRRVDRQGPERQQGEAQGEHDAVAQRDKKLPAEITAHIMDDVAHHLPRQRAILGGHQLLPRTAVALVVEQEKVEISYLVNMILLYAMALQVMF